MVACGELDEMVFPAYQKEERGFLFVSNKTRRRGEFLARPFVFDQQLDPQQVVSPSGAKEAEEVGNHLPTLKTTLGPRLF